MTKTGLSLSIFVGLVFLLAVPILADFQAGVDAYERGDYATALNTFRPLAEQGEAQAQFKLGVVWECPAGPFAESGSGKPKFLRASGTLCDH